MLEKEVQTLKLENEKLRKQISDGSGSADMIKDLQREIEELKRENEELRRKLDEARREAGRGGVPDSRPREVVVENTDGGPDADALRRSMLENDDLRRQLTEANARADREADRAKQLKEERDVLKQLLGC